MEYEILGVLVLFFLVCLQTYRIHGLRNENIDLDNQIGDIMSQAADDNLLIIQLKDRLEQANRQSKELVQQSADKLATQKSLVSTLGKELDIESKKTKKLSNTINTQNERIGSLMTQLGAPEKKIKPYDMPTDVSDMIEFADMDAEGPELSDKPIEV